MQTPQSLGAGYTLVAYSQVTLNGRYMASLPIEGTDIAVLGPDGRALTDESGRRPYRYASQAEAAADVETLKKINTPCQTSPQDPCRNVTLTVNLSTAKSTMADARASLAAELRLIAETLEDDPDTFGESGETTGQEPRGPWAISDPWENDQPKLGNSGAPQHP